MSGGRSWPAFCLTPEWSFSHFGGARCASRPSDNCLQDWTGLHRRRPSLNRRLACHLLPDSEAMYRFLHWDSDTMIKNAAIALVAVGTVFGSAVANALTLTNDPACEAGTFAPPFSECSGSYELEGGKMMSPMAAPTTSSPNFSTSTKFLAMATGSSSRRTTVAVPTSFR